MFTGLIRELGEVKSYSKNILCIKAEYIPSLGDSIAVNGICLTVISLAHKSFCVELSLETRTLIAHENLKNKVHIEPAMRVEDRLDGHIVQGHIDGIGTISSIKKEQNALDFTLKIPHHLMPLMMPKGSIAIDGVSLTVNEVLSDSIRLTIIPHTFKNTLFETYTLGRRVNVESDMFARYIYNILKPQKKLSWDDVDTIMNSY